MLPRLHTPEPLSPRLRSALLGVVIPDAAEQDADIVILPASSAPRVVQLWRDRLPGRLILGLSDGLPATEHRVRWIRAGADDLCAAAELPEALGRLWEEQISAGAGRVEQFFWELQAYLQQRNGLAEALGGGAVARLTELGRRRDAALLAPEGGVDLPQGFRWPVESLAPRCDGSLLRLHPDALQISLPEALKLRDPIRLVVRTSERSWLVAGEVQRALGTAGSWWVYAVGLLQLQLMDSAETTG